VTTDCTDLPSEMLAADSQMNTSFFMLQRWMLDSEDWAKVPKVPKVN